MANNIKFTIGSSFNGEGFKAVDKALQQNKKEIQAAQKGLGELTNAFSNVSPVAAQATGAVSGFTQAFIQGGIVGGVITLAMQALGSSISYVKDKIAEAKEETKKWRDAIIDIYTNAFTRAKDEYASFSEEVQVANSHLKDLQNTLNSGVAHSAATKVYEVTMAGLQQITDQMTEETKAVVRAQTSYKVAMIKCAATIEQTENNERIAQKELNNARELEKAAKERIYIAEQTYERLCQERNVSQEQINKARQELEAATKAEANASHNVEVAQQKVIEAQNKKAEAVQNQAIAEEEFSQKIKDAQKKELEAKEKLAKEELEQAEQLAKEKQSWKDYVQEMRMKLDDTLAERKEDADYEARENERKLKKANIQNVKITNPKDISSSFGVTVQPLKEAINKPKGLDDETFERIQNGTASVADKLRYDRYKERQDRDNDSQLNRIKTDAVTFLSNANKPDSFLSKTDSQFQEIFKSQILPLLSEDVATKLLQESSKHVLMKSDLEAVMNDAKTIRAWLSELGLK